MNCSCSHLSIHYLSQHILPYFCQVGNALSGNQSKNKNSALGSSVPNRILICAPSNFAVDELAWRLKKTALGTSGKVGDFKIIRFGNFPGEERHDKRGKKCNGKNTYAIESERDWFLRSINLDDIVEKIAKKRELLNYNYAAYKESDPQNKLNRKNTKHISFSLERQKVLHDCHIVCCTLSGAGSKAFAEAVARDDYPYSEFDTVIIDEACQASEPSSLIPLKFNPNSLVLVGDPQQLPVVVVSQQSKKCGFSRSLFQRLSENGWPVELLRVQYRMHPQIAAFPSFHFYEKRLITESKIEAQKNALWHKHTCFPPYLVWNLESRGMQRTRHGGIMNTAEISFIMRVLKKFRLQYSEINNLSIGIIAFYNEQVRRHKIQRYGRFIMSSYN